MRQRRLLAGALLAVLTWTGMACTKDDARHAENGVQKGVFRSVKLYNSQPNPLGDIEINFVGKDARDFRQTNDCGEKLAGKSSCTINVWFEPTSAGKKNAIMEIHTSRGKQSVPLSGKRV